jgi:hypothetical protein
MKLASIKKNATLNIILLLISLLISLLIIEISLRIFYSKYKYAAESCFIIKSDRIWARKAGSHYIRKHPDSHQPHPVYHNNLALRQHRNFSKHDLESAINIAFFGDSFTENLRLPSQYSFTEPLDYLLNLSPKKCNTLNFGVDGYGPDQLFLYYRDFEYSGDLDYVFYVFCGNDLRNIYENNLFTINNTGDLIQNKAFLPPWWIRLISKFHTTYLILDIRERLLLKNRAINEINFEEYLTLKYHKNLVDSHKKRFHSKIADAIQANLFTQVETGDMDKSIAIFQALLHFWEESVEKNGGKFYILTLPQYNKRITKKVLQDKFNVIALHEKFRGINGHYNHMDYRFKTDCHLNETANQLAAVFLYRLIEKEEDLPPIDLNTLKEQIYTYYSSFDGWLPDDTQIKRIFIPPEKKKIIQAKYTELEWEGFDSDSAVRE